MIKPEVVQPQQVIKNPPLQAQEGTLIDNKTLNSALKPTENAPSISNTTNQEKEIIIRDKRAYKAFIRLIKQGKYTSATVSARLTGVSRQTISSWLQTRKVQEAMSNEVNQYVSDIKASKDWKAKAYLLDKLEDKDNTKDTTVNLTNLIQVNTVAPSTTTKGTVTI